MNVTQTMAAIRQLGLTVRRLEDEWRINFWKGKEATAYYTYDNVDALNTAVAMAAARQG